jgi:tetratricopeptide (TPR) repeat protein
MNKTSFNTNSLFLKFSRAIKEKKYLEAKNILEKILSINPNIFEANHNLAILSLQIGDIDNSILYFEKTTKDICKFLDIVWSDETKNFYKTGKDRLDISTPSYDQVTSPLYSKSVNRWKNYEKEFEGVKNLLDRWANEFDYKI